MMTMRMTRRAMIPWRRIEEKEKSNMQAFHTNSTGPSALGNLMQSCHYVCSVSGTPRVTAQCLLSFFMMHTISKPRFMLLRLK